MSNNINKKDYKLDYLPKIASLESEVKNPETYTTIAAKINIDYMDKVKDYIYWEGITITEFISSLLIDFFKDKQIKSRPEKLKNRERINNKSKLRKI